MSCEFKIQSKHLIFEKELGTIDISKHIIKFQHIILAHSYLV